MSNDKDEIAILSNLNKQQKAAVLYTDGSLRIIAGAGSGKTKVLTNKIAYLVEELKVQPEKILAITFTNKAANEMLHRVNQLVGEKSKRIQISTYHSLAVRILRAEINKHFNYPKYFTILDTVDQKQILGRIYKRLGANIRTLSYGKLIDFISKNKMLFTTPEEAKKSAKTDGERMMCDIYGEYVKRQKEIFALDFDDLLLFTHQLFKENPLARKRWSNTFDYLLVDEFQDTSEVQYEIIKIFGSKNITVVGDPDQTIYTWRGASVDLILNFDKDFPYSKTIKLEQNYRSTKRILDYANLLIKHNKRRLSKNLFSENEKGEEIVYQQLNSPDAEARWIVKTIKELQTKKIKLKDMAIFYRANYLSKNMEQALINENIDYRVFGSLKFFQRQEIKDAVAYLKILSTDDEPISFYRMINVPSRKLGDSAQEKLMKFADDHKMTLQNVIIKHFGALPVTDLQRTEIHSYMQLISKYRKALKTNKPSAVLVNFLQEVGYLDMWKRVDEQDKIINLKEFAMGLKEWEGKNPNKELADYLQEISLYTDNEHFDNLTSFISLMTVHSAKGLEFDYVFVMGMSEGVFPSQKGLDENPDSLEEERRLAYVALTRARKMVYLTSSRGYSFEDKTQKTPSRFITEIGLKQDKFVFEDYSTIDYIKNYSDEEINWVVGDKVLHKIFDKGTIVKVNDDTIEIAFKKPHNVKTLMKNHKSIIRR